MALDICVESYGIVVQALDTGLMSHISSWTSRAEQLYRTDSFDAQELCEVKQHAEQLVFPEAKALWLVDVCGCSYVEAAAEMRIGRDELASYVAEGRTQIRAGLTE